MTKALRSLIFALSCACVAAPVQAMLSTGTILWYAGPSLAFVAAKVMRFFYDKSRQLDRVEEKLDILGKEVTEVQTSVNEVAQNVEIVKNKIENIEAVSLPQLEGALKEEITKKLAPIIDSLDGENGIRKKDLPMLKEELLNAIREKTESFPSMFEKLEQFVNQQIEGLTKKLSTIEEAVKEIPTMQKNVQLVLNNQENARKAFDQQFSELQQKDAQIEKLMQEHQKNNEQKLDKILAENQDVQKQLVTMQKLQEEFKQQLEDASKQNNEVLAEEIKKQYILIQENIINLLSHKFVTQEEFKKTVESFNEKLSSLKQKNEEMHEDLKEVKSNMAQVLQLLTQTKQTVDKIDDSSEKNKQVGEASLLVQLHALQQGRKSSSIFNLFAVHNQFPNPTVLSKSSMWNVNNSDLSALKQLEKQQ